MLRYRNGAAWIGALSILCILIGGPVPVFADDVNLTFTPATGWSCPVVPSDDDDSTETSCLLPPVLWTQNIFWNAHGENLGSDSTPGGFDVTYFVDGQTRAMAYAPATAGEFYVLNEGPGDYMDRGLHTVHGYVDAFHAVTETDETDNYWGRQFWGSAMTLPVDHTAWISDAPPSPEGGWEFITEGGTPQENCHGYRVFTGDAQAVVAAPIEADDDYALRLHEGIESSPLSVPASPVVTSDRGPGSLEAVFAFGYYGDEFTATVVNRNQGTGNYHTFREAESDVELGETRFFYMLRDHLLRLLCYGVPPESQGWIRATVETDPGVELHLATFDPVGACYMNLDDAAATAVTGPDGTAVLSWQVFDSSDHYVVVYREAVDLPETGVGFEITIDHPDPVADLAPAGEDWWSPLVPSSSHQTSGPVGEPGVLTGNAAATHYNFQFRNAGYAGTGTFLNRYHLDGISGVPIIYMSGLSPQVVSSYRGSVAQTVRGGRHTLSVIYDTGNAVDESDETNNWYAEQYVWTPLELDYGTVITRSAPPDPLAGTAQVPDGVTVHPNCDGLRLPRLPVMHIRHGWWRAAAAMPTTITDQVDLFLHEASDGPLEGFGESPMWTSTVIGGLAYVVVNYHQNDNVDYDVGLRQGPAACAGDVSIEAASSLWVDADDGGSFGPYTLAAGQCLDLLDLPLDARRYALQVDNLSGAGQLVATLHQTDVGFASCSAGIVPGGVDVAEDGGPVAFTVDLTTAGSYGLAIWKRNADDLDSSISYRLRILPDVIGVDDTPPVGATGLLGAYPNPFNPRTTIAFDLLHEQPVTLSVYDMSGRLVDVLVDDELVRPGRHEVSWQGQDRVGRRLPSGTYLYRLEAGGFVETRRMTLLK